MITRNSFVLQRTRTCAFFVLNISCASFWDRVLDTRFAAFSFSQRFLRYILFASDNSASRCFAVNLSFTNKTIFYAYWWFCLGWYQPKVLSEIHKSIKTDTADKVALSFIARNSEQYASWLMFSFAKINSSMSYAPYAFIKSWWSNFSCVNKSLASERPCVVSLL